MDKAKRNLLQKKLKKIEYVLQSRRGNDKLFYYNKGKKVHKKQLLFHACPKRNRWVFGGNRSGKTECGAVETVWFARGIHPYRKNKRTEGWVVSLSRSVQREVAQSKVLSYIHPSWIADIVMDNGRKDSPEGGVIDYILIKNVFGTLSKIGFKSCDQGREKFQGTSLDYVWFDEEPPKDIYDECKMRVLDTCGDIFGTMTPLKGLTFVYNLIYLNDRQDKEVWCEHIEWADNPFLSQEEVDSLSASMSEEELESRRYGKFVGNGGAVYSEFEENLHVIEPFPIPLDWQDTLSIDPGLNNPLSCHWYAVDFDGNIYVVAEHYEAKKDIAYHSQKIKEQCEALHWHTKNGYIEALIDSAATQRTLSAEKSVLELFYDNGILVNPKVDKNLFSGIQRVKSLLRPAGTKKPRLYIFKTCTNMIREIKGYYWGKGDNPIKKDDHAMDELRYYAMSKPEPTHYKSEKSEIQKDKERLYKRLKFERK